MTPSPPLVSALPISPPLVPRGRSSGGWTKRSSVSFSTPRAAPHVAIHRARRTMQLQDRAAPHRAFRHVALPRMIGCSCPPLPTSLDTPSPSHRPWCHVAGTPWSAGRSLRRRRGGGCCLRLMAGPRHSSLDRRCRPCIQAFGSAVRPAVRWLVVMLVVARSKRRPWRGRTSRTAGRGGEWREGVSGGARD